MDDMQLARRFGLIEQQLRALSDHLGVPCPAFASDGLPDAGRADGDAGAAGAPTGPPAVPAEVLELAQAGKSMQAVSLLRRLTGATLVEAKRAVDAL